MSGDRAKYIKRRQTLSDEQQGLCFWCGCEMTPPCAAGTVPKPTSLTLDHLYSKFHPERLAQCTGQRRRVAACFRCNQKRSRDECAQVPPATLWARARYFWWDTNWDLTHTFDQPHNWASGCRAAQQDPTP